jgi:DNA polymerase III alpha subunit
MSNTDRFAVDIEEMTEERILIPARDYKGYISKAELKTGTPKNDSTGIWYGLNLIIDVKDQEVAELVGNDTPKVFYSNFVSIDKESEKIQTNNPDFGALLKATGFKSKEANEIFHDAASEATTIREYNKLYLEKVASTLVGSELLITVTQVPKEKGSAELVNRVSKVAMLEE